MSFVDTSVIIDILEGDPVWAEWSSDALRHASASSTPRINHIVVAELAAQTLAGQDVHGIMDEMGISIVGLDLAAAQRAGSAFREYRRRGGEREAIIADFLIAGHADSANAALITRDRKRLATYFPELILITPETENA